MIWNIRRYGSSFVLRIYIDKLGGIDITDCENVSNNIKEELDIIDTKIKDTYTVEVSSCGVERKLTKPWHYEKYMGEKIKIKLYDKVENKKEYAGILKNIDKNNITIENEGKNIIFDKKNVASATTVYEW